MIYAYAFTDAAPFDVVVTVSGTPSYEEIREGRRRLLSDPRIRPGMNVLVDHAELDATTASAENLRALAGSAGSEWGSAGVAHLVMVAPQSVAFGLLRVWHASLSTKFAGRAAVVGSLTEAYAWLAACSGDETPD